MTLLDQQAASNQTHNIHLSICLLNYFQKLQKT